MKQTPTYTDKLQNQWEIWFIISVVAFLSFLFVGTLDNSRADFPNWMHGAIIVSLNLIACIIVGSIKR